MKRLSFDTRLKVDLSPPGWEGRGPERPAPSGRRISWPTQTPTGRDRPGFQLGFALEGLGAIG